MDMLEFIAQELARAADDTAGSLMGSKLGLYKVETDINQNTLLSTMTANKATFTGYVKTALVWGAPSIADDGSVECVAAPLPFRPTDSAGGDQVIWGCWIEDSTAAVLQFAGQFDLPSPPMNGPLDTMLVTVRYRPASQTVVVLIS